MTKPKRTIKRTTQPITGTPERLALLELREMSTLCKRHWGSGSIRDLVAADGHYRPNLITKVFPSKRERRIDQGWSKEELAAFSADCAERERLAVSTIGCKQREATRDAQQGAKRDGATRGKGRNEQCSRNYEA